ncbi:MAG: class E sortase [Coriobacteriia bacterium]|nr:class E sortase [Coriobacteriia bacterium]
MNAGSEMTGDVFVAGRSPGPAATISRALGNVFIGVALGLGCYYGLTDLAGHLRQDVMRDSLEGLGAVAAADPGDHLVEPTADSLDFTGWAEEDEAYWLALEDGGPFGRLIIEEMELDTVVVKGQSRENLKKGPAWVDYTDLPGPTGNCGISGHRTTYAAPFRRLDDLEQGDTIDLYSPFRRYRYRVDDVFEVTPDKVEVMDSTEEPSLTLTACHPPYSARYRLVVRATLAEVVRFEESSSLGE